jgi:hypothetical protein
MTEKLVRSIKKEVNRATHARKRTFLFKCARRSIIACEAALQGCQDLPHLTQAGATPAAAGLSLESHLVGPALAKVNFLAKLAVHISPFGAM